jgi:aspartate aminotransferase-like enzyme
VETALSNVPSRGDRVLALKSGKFAVDWGYSAARLGPELRFLKATGAMPCAKPRSIRLRQDRGGKVIVVMQIDASPEL